MKSYKGQYSDVIFRNVNLERDLHFAFKNFERDLHLGVEIPLVKLSKKKNITLSFFL